MTADWLGAHMLRFPSPDERAEQKKRRPRSARASRGRPRAAGEGNARGSTRDDTAGLAWFKAAADWTTNTKLRRLELDGVVAWFALLAANAAEGWLGLVPGDKLRGGALARRLEPWGIDEDRAAELVLDLEAARLIEWDDDQRGARIVGWDPDEWGAGRRCRRCKRRRARDTRATCDQCGEAERIRSRERRRVGCRRCGAPVEDADRATCRTCRDQRQRGAQA